MKAIADKCDLIVTTKDTVSANIENVFKKNEEKILGNLPPSIHLKIMSPLQAKMPAKTLMHLLEF